MKEKLLNLTDVARLSDTSRQNVWLYYKQGLIKPIYQNKNGRSSLYTEDTVDVVKTIRKLTRLYNWRQIKVLMDKNEIESGLKNVELLGGVR
jgi:DNA-binding transcriptional MerR regulator